MKGQKNPQEYFPDSIGDGALAIFDSSGYQSDSNLRGVLQSRKMDLSSNPAKAFKLSFNSFWDALNEQEANVYVLFDTGEREKLIAMSNDDFGSQSKHDKISLEFEAPTNATSMQIEFEMALGSKIWAIDNVSVGTAPEEVD